MANKGYMPRKESEQVAWSANFVSIVGGSEIDFGVPIPMMTAFTAINTSLQAAWLESSQTSTRTRGSLLVKDGALKAMKAAAKPLVSIIQGAPGVTNDMLANAGLTVRKTKPTPSPVPTQKPFIKLTNVDGRVVSIELMQDSARRGKPNGVVSATILTAVGPTAPTSMDGWSFYALTGRTKFDIAFPPSTTSDTVHVTAFWANGSKESGPAARAVSANLAAGGIVASEMKDPMRLKAA